MAGQASRENGKKGGRPKGPTQGTLDKMQAREYVRQRVTAALSGLLDAQLENAQGVSQFVYRDASGRFKVIDDPLELESRLKLGQAVRIFTRLPNVAAFADLLNRALDKPAEQLKVTGAEGGPVEFKWRDS